MRVSDFLSSAEVTIDAAFADKQKLLEDLARRAAAIVDLAPDLILAELQKREELGSTGKPRLTAVLAANSCSSSRLFEARTSTMTSVGDSRSGIFIVVPARHIVESIDQVPGGGTDFAISSGTRSR